MFQPYLTPAGRSKPGITGPPARSCDTCVLGEGHPLQGVYLHCWGCAYQDTCVLGEGHPLQGVYLITGGVHTRMHVYWGRSIHYRGCTFIAGGVHTRMHVYWGRGIHYRGCTFITGGVHTRTHVYWGGASTTGVYLHRWGCAYQDACVLGEGHPLQGVYSHDKKKSYQPVHSIGPISSPIEHTGW